MHREMWLVANGNRSRDEGTSIVFAYMRLLGPLQRCLSLQFFVDGQEWLSIVSLIAQFRLQHSKKLDCSLLPIRNPPPTLLQYMYCP